MVSLFSWVYRHRLSPVGMRWPVPFAWAAGAAVIVGAVSLMTSNLDQRGIAPPSQARWPDTAVTTAVSVAAAVMGWVLAGREPSLPDARSGPQPSAPRLDLRPPQRAMWCRTVTSPHTAVTAGAMAVAAVVGMSISGLGVVAVLVAAAAAGFGLQASVLVRVSEQAVTVTQPLLGRALITLPYRHIEEAYVEQSPSGLPAPGFGLVADGPVFGYRSRLTGPALRLRLADRRDCILTVDDAITAAALINTYLDRNRPSEIATGKPC
jgi:hypothetical protein